MTHVLPSVQIVHTVLKQVGDSSRATISQQHEEIHSSKHTSFLLRHLVRNSVLRYNAHKTPKRLPKGRCPTFQNQVNSLRLIFMHKQLHYYQKVHLICTNFSVTSCICQLEQPAIRQLNKEMATVRSELYLLDLQVSQNSHCCRQVTRQLATIQLNLLQVIYKIFLYVSYMVALNKSSNLQAQLVGKHCCKTKTCI